MTLVIDPLSSHCTEGYVCCKAGCFIPIRPSETAGLWMGLGYPGGVEVEKAAKTGNPGRFKLPRPMFGRPNCHFSFSGLKTALREQLDNIKQHQASDEDIADLCASFQSTVAEVIADRCHNAAEIFKRRYHEGKYLVVAGGVASNQTLRQALEAVAKEKGMTLIAPPPNLCTDNGAMVAACGYFHLGRGLVSTQTIDVDPGLSLG